MLRVWAHSTQTMAALYSFSCDPPVAVNNKIKSPLHRLPLEPRQDMYTIILHPQRLVNEPWGKSLMYRLMSEKLCERVDLEREGGPGCESEGKLSESGHRGRLPFQRRLHIRKEHCYN